MKHFRLFLAPFALLYGLVVWCRNKCYDWGIFKTYTSKTPTLLVGNLSMGGTGKSPQIAYLADWLTRDFKVAMLSRGYGRKTKGWQLVDAQSTVAQVGDEPLQLAKRFPNVIVAVQEDRTQGLQKLQKEFPNVQLILMDDGFQHRAVRAHQNILLTAYDALYADDYLLPMGNLREARRGSRRADMVVVTKCPDDLNKQQRKIIIAKIRRLTPKMPVFFTKIAYDNEVIGVDASLENIALKALKSYGVLLVTGIAKPKTLIDFLKGQDIAVHHLSFADHRLFTDADIVTIQKRFKALSQQHKIILTTEKDATRLCMDGVPLYCLKIKTRFFSKEEEKDFREKIRSK